ncbi:MAG: hypothetical protein HUU55_11705 [Myxococcales bacterium]|nr:hypothetical protein [Myxococcales bacterium]
MHFVPAPPALRVIVVIAALYGCGAYDEDAPPVVSTHNCAPVNAQIATVLSLIESGQLEGLRQIVEVDVDSDLRRSVVELAFDVLGALPRESWPQIQTLVDADVTDKILSALADLLRFIDGDSDGTPRYYLTDPLSNVVATCVDVATIEWIQQLLNDKEVVAAFVVIAEDPTEVIELIRGLGIDFGDESSKTAVLSLIEGMLTSIATPGFSAGPILNLFYAVSANGLVDASDPAIKSFLFLLERVFATPEETEMVSQLIECIQLFDKQNHLIELLYDLLSQNLISVQALQDILVEVETFVPVFNAFLQLFVSSPDTWFSLQNLLVKLLVPSIAPKAIPDLATLIETGALTEVVSLLGSLAVGCTP